MLLYLTCFSLLELTLNSFTNLTGKDKPAFIIFYSKWNLNCQIIYQDLIEIGKGNKYNDDLIIAEVDMMVNKELGDKYASYGVPVLLYFGNRSTTAERYNGNRSIDSLTHYVYLKTGIQANMDRKTSYLVHLTDNNFDSYVNGSKHVLLVFTVPWDGRSKKLLMEFEKIAFDVAGENTVIIGNINMETEIQMTIRYTINGTPTLLFFNKGSTSATKLKDLRTEQEILDFINHKCGTHRVIGGGFESSYGLISEFTPLIEYFMKNKDNLEKSLKLANELNTVYAPYYVSIMEHLIEDSAFVETEIRILNRKLKNDLNPLIRDDYNIKLNILRLFKSYNIDKDEL